MITIIPKAQACVATFPRGTTRSRPGAITLIPGRPVRITEGELDVLRGLGIPMEVRRPVARAVQAPEIEAQVQAASVPAEAPAEAIPEAEEAVPAEAPAEEAPSKAGGKSRRRRSR